ncbi:MAG: hypothetical protein WD847_06145 [Pirellulales bacterium]
MPGPYYTMYLESVRLKERQNDHELDAKVMYTEPREALDELILSYKAAGAQEFTAWHTQAAATFGADAKTFPNPVPASYVVRLAGLQADMQKVLDTVSCVKPEVTAVQYVTGEVYRIAKNPAQGDEEYRVVVRAAATNVETGSYKMKLLMYNFTTCSWQDKGDSDVIGPDETLVYTWVAAADHSTVPIRAHVKVQLIESPGGGVFSETPEQEIIPFKDPEILPPPNRQGTRNMDGASIAVQYGLAEFHYFFKERESFYVPVGGTWMPFGGDMWLQIMYWDDNIGDWQLLLEMLNPSVVQYAAIRGFDQFLNFADYTIKAKLIGLTTVEDTKVITPNYDPDTGNGTVETIDLPTT